MALEISLQMYIIMWQCVKKKAGNETLSMKQTVTAETVRHIGEDSSRKSTLRLCIARFYRPRLSAIPLPSTTYARYIQVSNIIDRKKCTCRLEVSSRTTRISSWSCVTRHHSRWQHSLPLESWSCNDLLHLQFYRLIPWWFQKWCWSVNLVKKNTRLQTLLTKLVIIYYYLERRNQGHGPITLVITDTLTKIELDFDLKEELIGFEIM